MLGVSVGRRIDTSAAMAAASGVLTYPRLAARKVSMSLAVDRRAPAPASVGISQFGTAVRPLLWPIASRAFISGVRVTRVLVIPKGSQMRDLTDRKSTRL